MIALISDIHSNTEALGVVLDEVERLGAERIFCLGDVIGYGPEPRETLQRVIDCAEFSLLGNHEDGCMHYASDFNPRARAAIDWTRDQLNLPGHKAQNYAFWNYLSSMPKERREGPMLLVHGSPRDPVREYIVPRDAEDSAKLQGCFAKFGDAELCFVGHGHVPGVYPESGGFVPPQDLAEGFRLGQGRALINIGSVGQPRDGDPRAAFATFDGEVVRFHRVAYDHDATAAKIRAIPELPDYLADRLGNGR